MAWRRQRSVLFAPASASFRIPMICSSVNRFRFIAGPPRGHPSRADSHIAWSSFRGAGRSGTPYSFDLQAYDGDGNTIPASPPAHLDGFTFGGPNGQNDDGRDPVENARDLALQTSCATV